MLLDDAPPRTSSDSTERQRRDLLRTALAAEIRACRRCSGLNQPGVTGSAPAYGDSMSPLAIVGQSLCGPPCMESQVPFTGGSGRFLDAAFSRARIAKSQIFITNVVHCHPPANRRSEPHEIANCAPFLARELDLVDPKLVIGLGKDAEAALRAWTASHPADWREDRPWATGASSSNVLLLKPHPSWLKFQPPRACGVWQRPGRRDHVGVWQRGWDAAHKYHVKMVALTRALPGPFTDDVSMNDTPPPARPWWLAYWAIAVGVFLGGEVFLFALIFIAGRRCDGDCEGAGIAALFFIVLMFAWAFVWLITASVLRLAWTIGAMLLGVRKPATPVEHTIVLPPRKTRR